jgi:hemerythrin-like domain-containing protein
MLARLTTDHDRIRDTLNLLEAQFLEMCRGRAPDYAMMLSIVAYIQEYPERAHHPLEDAVYSILIRRGGDGVKLSRELITDHTELEIITRKLRESLEQARSTQVIGETLKRQLSTFLARQRSHLYTEEEKIFPLVAASLTPADWDNIRSMLPNVNDPLFGERTHRDYELLYRAVDARGRQARDTGSPAGAR